jgi:hypothetical protein
MPLTELMNYFNDQLQTQARIRALPKTGFYKAESVYWARFGSLTLGTNFHAINAWSKKQLIGYEAELVVRASTGNILNIDSIFNSLDSIDQIVHLDRLVRTLHSLNYLQKFDGQDHLLSLHVQPRHIVSVTDDHGKIFESILSDCGLKPERVILHTRLLNNAALPHFNKALTSYKSKGYKIGVSLTQTTELTLLANLGLELDVIYVYHPASERLTKPEAANSEVAFIHPLELYSSKRILVSKEIKDRKNLQLVDKVFDGYLISQHEFADNLDSRKYVNYF